MKTKSINNIIQVIQYAGEKLTAFNIDDIKLVGHALGFSYDKDKYRRSLLSLQKSGVIYATNEYCKSRWADAPSRNIPTRQLWRLTK